MPFVRQHGNKLEIVHGVREPETRKVKHQVVFTFHSRAEVLDAMGDGADGSPEYFRHQIEESYPLIRFDWPRIDKSLLDLITRLPEQHDYRQSRVDVRFRKALIGFAGQLAVADPWGADSEDDLIGQYRNELRVVADILQEYLSAPPPEAPPRQANDRFFWRHALRGKGAPPEAEELAVGYFERGELDLARAAFGLLTEAFEDYAEGYNFLGLIALRQGAAEEAALHFRATVASGRKLIPPGTPKSSYWRDLKTRPYMRGMRNLAGTLGELDRAEEALALCDQLERECGDDRATQSLRATIGLNTGRWRLCADAASGLAEVWPEMGLVAAFALFELGQEDQARSAFVTAASRMPRTAQMVMDARTLPYPSSASERDDHNTGVELREGIRRYLKVRTSHALRFFAAISAFTPDAQVPRRGPGRASGRKVASRKER